MNYPSYGFNSMFNTAHKSADGELMEDILIKQIARFIVQSPYAAENILKESGVKTPENASTATIIKLYEENIVSEKLQKNLAVELTKRGSHYNSDGDEIVNTAQNVRSVSDSLKSIFGSGSSSKKSSQPKGVVLTPAQIQQAAQKYRKQQQLADAANQELAAQRAKNTNRTAMWIIGSVLLAGGIFGIVWYVRKNY